MILPKLISSGKDMDAEQLANDIRSLSDDPRFVAVATWLDRARHSAMYKASVPGKSHQVHHRSGSLSQTLELLASLTSMCNSSPKPVGRPKSPPSDEISGSPFR
jgi:hypothetical protein